MKSTMSKQSTDNSHFFRNLEEFNFIINEKNVIKLLNESTLVSDCKRVKLFLDGIIYNKNKEDLINGFVSEGVEYVKQLEGSFVIFLIHGSLFYLLTDKVNSRKAFCVYLDNSWYISNNIDNLPIAQCPISIDGIACYIANGVMLNELTLFQGIKCTKGATVYTFTNEYLSSD